jgi:Raf kinase inhibitor-like YbhB/YbcL family protein
MIKKTFLILATLIIVLVLGRYIYTAIVQKNELEYHLNFVKSIALASDDFNQNGTIPIKCTGYGQEVSPELHWDHLPEGTKSLVILCTDYDGPAPWLRLLTIDHWVLYNISVTVNSLAQGTTVVQLQNDSIISGKNFKGAYTYIGPKPPIGRHQYFFRIYALSISDLKLTNPTKHEVMEAMKNYVLAYGELVGEY